MANTTLVGDTLRDQVYDLVIAAQKRAVEKEKNIKGKKADVYFEESSTYQKVLRIAVECKNYSSTFDRSLFTSIFSEYHPAKEEIDCLIVITINKPTSSVSESLNSTDWIVHYTWSEFVSTLMDFSTYLQTLKARFTNEGLDKYYVPVRSKENVDLETTIHAWIEDETDSQARAILAGYGMGKSSFAKYIAFKYANEVNQGVTKRIPIYLKLGEIYSEQSLDGLLGKHLTSENIVRGYNFELFQAMNRNGLLLIILDGFDEMKHAMSKDEFAANLEQFSKLIVPKSKVLILGRPSAFISGIEADFVIKGKVDDDQILTSPAKPYKEIELAEFNQEQINKFIPQYLEYENKQANHTGAVFRNESFLTERATEILQGNFNELIERPVHAKMLCMLAISNDKKLEQFTRYQLYKSFLDEILKREYEKKARTPLEKTERKNFIQWVAWENWPTKGVAGFTYDDLKENPNYSENKASKAGQDILREQLVGSILDTKSHGIFFFSHRSFQEYLVAEYMLNNSWSKSQLALIDAGLNEEIISFLEESKGQSNFARKIFSLLSDYRESIRSRLFSFLWEHLDFNQQDFETKSTESSPWQIFILSAQGHFNSFLYKEKVEFIDELPGELAAALTLGITEQPDFDRNDAIKIVAMILRRNRDIVNRGEYHLGKLKNQVTLKNSSERIWVRILIYSLRGVFNSRNELENVIFSVSDIQRVITANVPGVSFSDIPRIGNAGGKSYKIGNLNLVDALLFDGAKEASDGEKKRVVELKRKLVMFLRSQPAAENFVEVSKSAEKSQRSILTLKK